jgi:hypothetical protein
MSKKFNGERCERRNLTDLVLGTGPTGMKRPVTKKKQPAKSTVPQMPTGGPTGGSTLDRNDPQFQSWLQTTSREFYPEYSGEALNPTEWFKYVNPYTDTQKYPSNIAVNPTLLPQDASSRYMSQEIGRASSPGAKRMTMTDAYSANEQRYNENRETEQLYNDWLSRQGSAPTPPGREVTVAEDGKSYTVSGPASQMPHGGSTHEAGLDPRLSPYYSSSPGVARDPLGRPVQDPSQMSYSMQTYGFEDGPITPTSNPLEQALFLGPGALMNAGRVAVSTAAKPVQIMGTKALKYGADALNSSLPIMSRIGAGLKSAYNAWGVAGLPTAVTGLAGGVVNQVQGKGSVANTLGMAEDVVNVLPGSKVLKTAVAKGYSAGEGIKIGEDIAGGDYASAFGRVLIGALPGDQSRINPGDVPKYVLKTGNKVWDSKPAAIPEMAYGGPSAYEIAMANHQKRMLANPGAGGEFSSEGSFPIEDFSMTPGQVPDALREYLKISGNASLFSGAGQAIGSYIQESGAPETGERPEANAEGVIGGALKGATNPLAMSAGPYGMIAGAIIGGVGAKLKSDKAGGEYDDALAEENEIRLNNNIANAKEFSTQALSQYDQQGAGGGYYAKYGGPLNKYYMGGSPEQVDYETEKSEVIMASPYDRPIAVGQGGYKQLSSNLYKGNGPSHAQGGIPTRGAIEPFVDNMGEQQEPYVFSDSKDMSFDATEILSMIR